MNGSDQAGLGHGLGELGVHFVQVSLELITHQEVGLDAVGFQILAVPGLRLVDLGHQVDIELGFLLGDVAGGTDAAVQAHLDVIALLLGGGNVGVGGQTLGSEGGDAGEVTVVDVLRDGIVVAADAGDLAAQQGSDLLAVAVVGDVVDLDALGNVELGGDDVVNGADAGAATFMVSFNDINGVPSSGNRELMDILRKQWGWDGLVVSDWGSIQQMIPHGYSADLKEAGRQAAEAGVDVDMEGYAYIGHLKELVEEGKISTATLDSLVRNVLILKERLGLFDNPYVDLARASRFYADASLDAARRMAAEGAILLKNDNNILPLAARPGKIAVAGPMADALHDQNGTWCFDLEKQHTVTPLAALRERYGEGSIIDARGLAYSRDRSTDTFKKSAKAASKADVILYFAGEEAVLSGEAHCRTDLTLPGAQAEEIAALKATGRPVVVVIMAGRPLEISRQNKEVDAILYTFHPGTMGGPAIVDVLSGDVNPSGHLPVSLPRTSGQMPLYYAHKNTGRPAEGMTLIDLHRMHQLLPRRRRRAPLPLRIRRQLHYFHLLSGDPLGLGNGR